MDINYMDALKELSEIELAFRYECLAVMVDFIHIEIFPPGEGYDFHTHSNYEFHYIYKGKGMVILNGEEYVLSQGSFYLTGPGVVHKQLADDTDPMVEYALKCDIKVDKLVSEQAEGHTKAEYRYLLNILTKKAFHVVEDKHNLNELFEKALEEAYYKRPGYYTQIKNAVLNIIVAAARNFSCETDVKYDVPKRDLNSYRMRMVQSYIADNYNKNITCIELARHVFLSSRQLNRIIKAETGYSVHDYIVFQKIEIIKELLTTTQLNLSSIAENTGFSSEFHLSNTFKKWVGVSPSKYREQSRDSDVESEAVRIKKY